LGKPLKIMHRPYNRDLPIYIAAIGPRNVQLAAEIADGWLPVFLSPDRMSEVYSGPLSRGFELSAENDKANRFDIAPTVSALLTDDMEAGRLSIKPFLALYIGGMGAKGRNFYHDLACRYGYQADADKIQNLYLEGKKMEATMSVPDVLVDELALVGSKEQIADRLDAWRDAGVTTIILGTTDIPTMRAMAELTL
jgi:alkanesulfonate monooxygenase SsuD/methylene tetrahydromethanopterin reductase-like flavin-dependent oxidoreductase (luciferase family)